MVLRCHITNSRQPPTGSSRTRRLQLERWLFTSGLPGGTASLDDDCFMDQRCCTTMVFGVTIHVLFSLSFMSFMDCLAFFYDCGGLEGDYADSRDYLTIFDLYFWVESTPPGRPVSFTINSGLEDGNQNTIIDWCIDLPSNKRGVRMAKVQETIEVNIDLQS
jgi:hypothetical protein